MAHDETMQALLASFNNPEHARRYGDGPRRFIPGFADLHRMTAILLAERASDDVRILVRGADGGWGRQMTHDSGAFIGDAQVGVAWRRGVAMPAVVRPGAGWRRTLSRADGRWRRPRRAVRDSRGDGR